MRTSELLVPLQNAVLGQGKTAQNQAVVVVVVVVVLVVVVLVVVVVVVVVVQRGARLVGEVASRHNLSCKQV